MNIFMRGAFRRIARLIGVSRVFIYYSVMGLRQPSVALSERLVIAAAIEGYKTTVSDWRFAAITDNPVFVNTHRRYHAKHFFLS